MKAEPVDIGRIDINKTIRDLMDIARVALQAHMGKYRKQGRSL